MSKTTEILNKYTSGEVCLEDTNEALKAVEANVLLDPDRNKLTAEELAATTVGDTPAQANGWGLMDHGASSMEKVQVVGGHTVNVDMGEELAYVFIGGRKYKLIGTELQTVAE